MDKPGGGVYFRAQIEPRLGGSIAWVGGVTFTEKLALLEEAACLIALSTWEEPFGLVIVEAFACGTPVVGLKRGAIPELVVDGTGVVCDRADQLGAAIAVAARLSPHACREHAVHHFDTGRMLDDYDALYRRVALEGL